ncbi:hypothetical protein [Streptomyces coelicoflavus]|uniref:hypothetical protein n=1 Tax=Streptomyces coelicoflavus TaxID=285562 RepID=UPI002E26EC79
MDERNDAVEGDAEPHHGRSSREDDGVDVLLTRAAAGDEQAFAGVYDALAPRVMGLVFRVLRRSGTPRTAMAVNAVHQAATGGV